MTDQLELGIADPRFSPLPLNPNPEPFAPSPDSSETVSCSTDLNSLNSLIDTSFWTLYLSKQVTDRETPGSGRSRKANPKSDLTPSASESIEQIYAASLDEIDRESASVAGKIAKSLKNGDEFTEPNYRGSLFQQLP
jgi:hypothetical protein